MMEEEIDQNTAKNSIQKRSTSNQINIAIDRKQKNSNSLQLQNHIEQEDIDNDDIEIIPDKQKMDSDLFQHQSSNTNKINLKPIEQSQFEQYNIGKNRTKVIIVENVKKIFSKISQSQTFDFKNIIKTQNDEAWQVNIKLETVTLKNTSDSIENIVIQVYPQNNYDDVNIQRSVTINCKAFYFNQEQKLIEQSSSKIISNFKQGQENSNDQKALLFQQSILKNQINVNGQLILDIQLSNYKTVNSKNNTECYIGLLNQGNTCYMNSFLQTMFHLKIFRKFIFSLPEYKVEPKDKDKEEEDQKKLFPNSMQWLFYKMMDYQSDQKKAISTKDLTVSFGWESRDGQVQQDVQEFQCVIFDGIEKRIAKYKDSYPQIERDWNLTLFKGKTKQIIRCNNVDFQSDRQEDFYDIKLETNEKSNLYQSLDQIYDSHELLVGDNQYFANNFGKQDATKSQKIIELPNVLILHLKRFGYDYQKNAPFKVQTKYEYYEKINMKKYMENKSDEQIYELFAVLVHQGQGAGGGHYYAYIKPNGPSDNWYRFNDQTVELSYPYHAMELSFGGSIELCKKFDKDKLALVDEVWPNQSTAYMLIYLKSSEINFLCPQITQKDYPLWIRDLIKEEQENLELQKKKEKYYNINICIFELMQKKSHSGYLFNKQSENYQIREIDDNVIHEDFLKTTTCQEFKNQITQKLGVPFQKLSFWRLIFNQKLQTERISSFTYYLTNEKLQDQNFFDFFFSLKLYNELIDDLSFILIILPIDSNLKLQFSYQGQPTPTYALQTISKSIKSTPNDQDLQLKIASKLYYNYLLIFVKIFNQQDKKSKSKQYQNLKAHSYYILEPDKKFSTFIRSIIEKDSQTFNDYDYKLYKEYNYNIIEIGKEQENLEINDIFNEELVSGILIFDLFSKSYNDQTNKTNNTNLIQYFNKIKTQIQITFCGISDEFLILNDQYTFDSFLDQNSDYYDFINEIYKNISSTQKFKHLKKENIYLQYRDEKQKKNIDIDIPSYKESQSNDKSDIPKDQLTSLKMIKPSNNKIYFLYDPYLQANERNQYQIVECSFYDNFSNTESQIIKLKVEKDATIQQLLEEAKKKPELTEYFQVMESFDSYRVVSKEKDTEKIVQICKNHLKIKKKTNNIFRIDLQPTETKCKMICLNYTRMQEDWFGKSFIINFEKNHLIQDFKNQIIDKIKQMNLEFMGKSVDIPQEKQLKIKVYDDFNMKNEVFEIKENVYNSTFQQAFSEAFMKQEHVFWCVIEHLNINSKAENMKMIAE